MSLLIISLAASFPSSLFSSYIAANENFIIQRLLNLIKTIFNPLINLPLLLMGYGVVGYTLVTVCFNIFIDVINIVYATSKLGMRFSFHNAKWTLFKEIAIFSFFILLNQIIDQVNSNVGSTLLGIYQGSIAVAIYGVAKTITNYFFSFSTVISSVYAPQVNKLVASDSKSTAITGLMTSVGRIQFIIMALILSGLYIFGKPFIVLWAGADYIDAYYIILLLCTPVVVPLIQNIGIEIQRAMYKHQVRSIAYSIMAVANVVISIPLIKTYGAIGAAVGTAISYVLCNIIFMNIYYQKGLHLDMVYFWKEIAKFIPALIPSILLGIIILITDINLYSWKSLFLWIVIYTVVYMISMWFLGMNKGEQETLLRIFRKVFKTSTKSK